MFNIKLFPVSTGINRSSRISFIRFTPVPREYGD